MDSEEYNFRYECGICQPSQMIKFNQREEIVSALAMHTIYSIKAELDQIISGLDGYGLGKLAQDNPEAFRPLLVYYKPLKLSADAVYEVFPAGLSALGSNTRDAQEAALMHWVNYTQAVEGEYMLVFCFQIDNFAFDRLPRNDGADRPKRPSQRDVSYIT